MTNDVEPTSLLKWKLSFGGPVSLTRMPKRGRSPLPEMSNFTASPAEPVDLPKELEIRLRRTIGIGHSSLDGLYN